VVLGLALLSTWLHADLHATTIVVIEYQGQVIIAADSLASTQFPGVTRSACKIRYINGMAVALTGPINNPEVEYDAWLTVRDVLRTTTSPRNAIGRIARLLLEPLRAHVQFEQRESLPRYQRLVDGDGTVLNIILSAIENDRQILLATGFGETVEGDPSSIRPVPRDECVDAGCVSLFGRIQNATAHLPTMGGLTVDRAAAFAEELVQVEIAADTDGHVGGPIDIIRLTRDGIEWVARKPECAEREGE